MVRPHNLLWATIVVHDSSYCKILKEVYSLQKVRKQAKKSYSYMKYDPVVKSKEARFDYCLLKWDTFNLYFWLTQN